MIFKQILPFPILVILVGCVQTYHIEELAIVTASGTDFAENDQIEETFVYFDFEEKKALPKIVTGKGTTIVGAAMDARLKVKFRLIPDKMQLKMYGSEVAKQGLTPYIDMLSRDPKQIDDMAIVLSETTAKELLESQENSPIEGDIGQHLEEIIKKNSPNNEFPYVPLNRFLAEIEDHGIDPILPIFSTDEKNTPKITSIALFRDDKFIDKLPVKDMLLFNLLEKGTVKNHRFEISLPIEPFNKFLKEEHTELKHVSISFELIKGNNTTQIVKDDPLTFQTNINMDLSIVELIGPMPLKNPEVVNLMEKEIEKQFTTRYEKLIETLQELNVDPIGLGNKYRIHQRKQVLTKTEWRDQFPNVDVKFDINVTILDYGVHS